MLWSPSEVLSFLKDDSDIQTTGIHKVQNKLNPTAAFGAFQTWPSPKEDFILIAENSEIHGPNPLFTIPQLQFSEKDLNALATQILSADYQGLSNNKILPGKNAQLLMPDLASDVHAAIIYFFLFDSEARGFIRPTCLAYFTSDKYKLIKSAESILKRLSEASSILQHSNIQHCTEDLKSLKENVKRSDKVAADSSNMDGSAPEKTQFQDIMTESVLKEIQDIIEVVEGYEGNKVIDSRIGDILDYLKRFTVSEKIRNFVNNLSSPDVEKSRHMERVYQPKNKKSMKNLYHTCFGGLVLGLYHLYIMHKYFCRKYENIALAEYSAEHQINNDVLHFGACIKQLDSCGIYSRSRCKLNLDLAPRTFFLEKDSYLENLDSRFESILLNFLNWDNGIPESLEQSNNLSSSCILNASIGEESSSSNSSGYLSNECLTDEETITENQCRHVTSLDAIWDVLSSLKEKNPGVEEAFLEILKLFDDTEKFMFSVLTRTPIVIISTPQELATAQNFIKALSVFIPRRKDEILFVDIDRKEPLKAEHFSNMAAVNICLHNHHVVEDVLPLESLPSLCILNLKDCSFTAPSYNGRILSNIDQRIRILPLDGPVFSIIVGVLSEVERIVMWWQAITSTPYYTSAITDHVLSKDFTRLDMMIIEKLFMLVKR